MQVSLKCFRVKACRIGLILFMVVLNLECSSTRYRSGIFANYSVPIHVLGSLSDSTNGNLIDGASVMLFSIPMRRPDGELLGYSDAGKIDVRAVLNYGGLEVGAERYESPKDEFEIRVSHPEYKTFSREFSDYRSLPERDEYRVVELGDIMLISAEE